MLSRSTPPVAIGTAVFRPKSSADTQDRPPRRVPDCCRIRGIPILPQTRCLCFQRGQCRAVHRSICTLLHRMRFQSRSRDTKSFPFLFPPILFTQRRASHVPVRHWAFDEFEAKLQISILKIAFISYGSKRSYS